MIRYFFNLLLLFSFFLLKTEVSLFESPFLPFEDYCGISERSVKKEWKERTLSQFCDLKKLLNGEEGTFYTQRVTPFVLNDNKKKNPNISFSVVKGHKYNKDQVDIVQLQADPKNKGALFQVASNLDCLEADGGKKFCINDYTGYSTQGEMAVLSALPGIIDRMYLQPPIRLLQDFIWKGKKVPLSDGYFPYYDKMEEQFADMTQKDILYASSFVRVGVQHNVRVTTGKRAFPCSKVQDGFFCLNAQKITDTNQRITQVFTAALDPYKGKDVSTQGYKNFARTLLHAAYKGTLDVARNLGVKKVYLTLVGGGVFLNKYHWISEAISAAVNDLSCYELNHSIEIILIIYSPLSGGLQDIAQFYKDINLLCKNYPAF